MAPGRICWQFARSGVCNREQCRFLHQKPADTHKPQESQNGRPRNKEGGLKSGKNCREWQRDVEARCTAYISPESLEIFFGGARQLIERDAGTMQDVVRFLADEPGLRYIQQLVEKDFDCMPHHTKKSVFAAQMVPFLEVISHPKVLSSLVAEHHMGAIFNFIYGIGGTRAIKLFGSVCAVLKAVAEEENIPVKWLELSLLVFTKTLDVNSTAFVQEGLKTHALGLQEVLRSMNTESSANKLHVASRYLEQLLHRFDMGAQMSAVTELNETEKRNQILTLMAPQDPPGGRHDNDHADISAIQILPTLDEILSPRGEYLPECNPSRWHVGGREGLLDRNFRLLREDSVGPLRSIICQVLKEPERDITRRNQQRTYLYHGAKVVRFSLQFASGILFLVEFPQLQHLRGMEKSDREAWWKLSKRLQKGSLVCLTVNDTTVIFCTVSDIPLRRVAHNQKSNHKSQNLEDELAVLWMNPEEAFITLTPVNPDENTIRLLLDMLNAKGGSLSMIEFPGVLMAGFEATLRALQRMKQASYLPFENLLTFSSMTWDGPVKVPPPLYSLHNGFQFNLRCLMKDGSDFYVGPFGPVDLTRLKQNSILDEAQAVAVVDSLQRCVGLIQGPPGTGKSYTGIALVDVLLHNKRQGSANIGPVLCVAYTNHALDQLLEAFMDKGITSNIIRIGSQSKSDQIEACKLRIAAQRATKTKLEQAQEHNLYLEIGECEKKIETLRLHQIPHVRLPSHLRQRYPEHFQRLFGKDPNSSEALELKNPTRQIRDWLESGSNLPDSVSRPVEELIQTDIIATSTAERERLHGFWIQELRQANNDEAIRSFTAYTKTKHELEALRNELDLRCLSDADVIGVTTSGLARNLDMFSKLQAKFVLCEEAGEVLEAHLLTALLPSVEHVILIGDHQQLRPHIQNYNLSRENHDGGDRYSLDVSLFERLVEPRIALGSELPFATLETQRRMHPSIARLVRDTIYPDLKDADNVSEYPEVCGMKKRLFWVDHRVPEADNSGTDGDIRTASHWNNYEVEMTIALVSHLVNQGKYKSGEIAVLTPYLGQLHRLRQRMSNLFTICIGERDQDQLDIEGFGMVDSIKPAKRTTLLQTVRVATIDNFQGEEAKVVIISLVRSNSQNRCGFLKTSNRINVLLSRAQHGLYIIGNSETAVHVPMWEQVVRILQEGNNIGSHLELQCPRHPETPINVSEPEHFLQFSPEGGCNLRCSIRLDCGHACGQQCHSEIFHQTTYCANSCQRPRRGCKHACPNKCGDPCPRICTVSVHKKHRRLECGHMKEALPCWQDQDPSKFACKTKVRKTVPRCQHMVSEPCYMDVTADCYKCQAPCKTELACGHICKRRCNQCRTIAGINHGSCGQRCGRSYSSCAHLCKTKCHGNNPCPPCQEVCDVSCSHSKCTKKCSEPCTPCAEEICRSSCPHSVCTMPCAAPCNHIPCSRRCEKKLECHHQCPSICGEACPPMKFCQVCARKEISDHVVDFILGETYKDINLDKNPCIFPKCGHFLTMESMDAQMQLSKYYCLDDEGKPVEFKGSSRPFSMEDIKTCALCRGHLRDISRYGRLVRRALLDESTKRFILHVNREYLPLAEELVACNPTLRQFHPSEMSPWPQTIEIKGPSIAQIKTMRETLGKFGETRWGQILRLREKILTYQRHVSPDAQPLIRVLIMVENARQRDKLIGRFECDSGALQNKGILLAAALRIRLDIGLLIDFMHLRQQAQPLGRINVFMDLQETRDECRTLIDTAKEHKRPLQEAEGYVYLAQLHALESSRCSNSSDSQRHFQTGEEAIGAARLIMSNFPNQTRGLLEDVESVDEMLRTTFYTIVTYQERLVIARAMASEFLGTGHWYYCRNRHPFTVGECGGPIEQYFCPECGAPVGGFDHQTADGVTRAEDIEEHFVQAMP